MTCEAKITAANENRRRHQHSFALWSAGPLAARIAVELAEAHAQGRLVVCAPVFAELLAHPKATQHFVEDFLAKTGIVVDFNLEESVWRQAAKSLATYARRRRLSAGDSPKRLLVDFIIASHGLLRADRLMTLDAKRHTHDFPNLRVV